MNKIVFILAVLLLSSCNYSRMKKPLQLDEGLQKISSPDEITFKMVNDSVIQPACLSCHSEAGGNRAGLNLENFENVFKNSHAIRLEVAGGTMPPRQKLTDQQIKLVTAWIDAGAHENGKVNAENPAPAPAPAPTPTPVPVEPPPVVPPAPQPPAEPSFTEVMNTVIKTNCFQCHTAANGNRGGVNLETYENIFAGREIIKFVVENGIMPTARGTALTPPQKQMLLTWIEQGAKP